MSKTPSHPSPPPTFASHAKEAATRQRHKVLKKTTSSPGLLQHEALSHPCAQPSKVRLRIASHRIDECETSRSSRRWWQPHRREARSKAAAENQNSYYLNIAKHPIGGIYSIFAAVK